MGRKKKPTSKKKRRRSGKKGRERDVDQQPAMPPEAVPAPDVVGAAAAPDADEEPPVIDLDADLGPSGDVFDADATPAVFDLDADLDAAIIDLDDGEDGTGGPEDVERLIAQTLAIDPGEEIDAEPDAPAIDLDADFDAGPEARPQQEPFALDGPVSDPAARGVPASEASSEPTFTMPSPADGSGPEGGRETEPAVTAAETGPAEAARRPADLGPVSSSAVRDRLLAEALAHAEHKDARYRVPLTVSTSAARWKLLAAGITLLLAGVAAVAPPGWARPDPPAPLGNAERAHGLRVALVLQAQQIEAFRVRTQRLPATLDEIGATLPGIRYVRSGNRAYQLIAYELDGNAIVYDSASPIDGPGTLDAGWAAPEVVP